MKLSKLAIIATLASFMFAGVNLTWGNQYMDGEEGMSSTNSFGVHFDVNDNTTVGWENGLMVGLAGPAGTTFRLGYTDAMPTLGLSYAWWEGAGTGWATSLSTAIDFNLTDGGEEEAAGDGGAGGGRSESGSAGDFSITVNLGFGF